jgi:peroxiredoxin
VKQLRSLRSFEDEFTKNDTAILPVVADRPERTREFREREKLGYEILTDADGAFFAALGVKRRRQVRGRPYAHPTTIILDREGVVRFLDVRRVLFTWRPSNEKLLARVKKLD